MWDDWNCPRLKTAKRIKTVILPNASLGSMSLTFLGLFDLFSLPRMKMKNNSLKSWAKNVVDYCMFSGMYFQILFDNYKICWVTLYLPYRLSIIIMETLLSAQNYFNIHVTATHFENTPTIFRQIVFQDWFSLGAHNYLNETVPWYSNHCATPYYTHLGCSVQWRGRAAVEVGLSRCWGDGGRSRTGFVNAMMRVGCQLENRGAGCT